MSNRIVTVLPALLRMSAMSAAAAALLLSGPALAQKRGGTLTMLLQSEPSSLGSPVVTAAPIGATATKIYEGLLDYDFALKPQPSLATEWSQSADGKTITFKLRAGVTWHDGKPFTSEDVAFSVTKILKPNHPRGMLNFGAVETVETPDPLTAVFKLSRPSPAMLRALSGHESPMVPKHLWESVDPKNNRYHNEPVGTGPFVFKEWVKGSHITVERYANYWRSGMPYLDRIVMRVVADPGTRSAALEKGEAQVAVPGAISLADVDRLRKLPSLDATAKGDEAFNPLLMLEVNHRRPPLNDIRVRKAMMHALNRQFIVDNIWYGFGKVPTGPIPSSFKDLGFYEDNVAKYDYDPKKAKALLDEAGLKPDGSGTRFKLTLDVLPYGPDWRRLGEFVKEAFGEVGINVTLRTEDLPSFLRRVYTTYDFDLTTNIFLCLSDPSLGVQRVYWSKNIRPGVVFTNSAGYNNPKVDELWEQAQIEPDQAKRAKQFSDVQKIIVDEVPVIWLSEMDDVVVHNKRVKDVVVGPEGVRTTMHQVWME